MTVAYLYCEKPAAAAELVGLARSQDAETVLIAIGGVDEGMLAAGADRALVLKGASERPEAYAKPIADILGDSGDAVLLASSTVAGRELAASVAGILDCAMVSDVSSLDLSGGALRAEHTIYGGAVVEIREAALPCAATFGAGVFDPVDLPATSDVEEREVEADARVSRKALKPARSGDVDLTKANAVVCVGMGIDGEEDLALAQSLADALGGAVGCTRDVAEGRKLLPKDRYIGITGAVIKPSLYLSLGVSGQLQHVYGIRDSKVIVAVDTNKDAPIFRAADYGIVGDLHDVAPRIIDALKA